MQEEFRTSELLRIWWSFVWRFVLGSLVLGFVVGFVFGFVVALTHALPKEQINFYAQIGGAIVSLFWSLCVVVMVLHKKYRGFRIVAVRGDLPLCRME